MKGAQGEVCGDGSIAQQGQQVGYLRLCLSRYLIATTLWESRGCFAFISQVSSKFFFWLLYSRSMCKRGKCYSQINQVDITQTSTGTCPAHLSSLLPSPLHMSWSQVIYSPCHAPCMLCLWPGMPLLSLASQLYFDFRILPQRPVPWKVFSLSESHSPLCSQRPWYKPELQLLVTAMSTGGCWASWNCSGRRPNGQRVSFLWSEWVVLVGDELSLYPLLGIQQFFPKRIFFRIIYFFQKGDIAVIPDIYYLITF